MTSSAVFTHQTLLCLQQEEQALLEKTAEHLCRVERCLFANYAKGKKLASLKSSYLTTHKITARQFKMLWLRLSRKLKQLKNLL